MTLVAPCLINNDDITQSTGNGVYPNGYIMEICQSCKVAMMPGCNNAWKWIACVLTAVLRRSKQWNRPLRKAKILLNGVMTSLLSFAHYSDALFRSPRKDWRFEDESRNGCNHVAENRDKTPTLIITVVFWGCDIICFRIHEDVSATSPPSKSPQFLVSLPSVVEELDRKTKTGGKGEFCTSSHATSPTRERIDKFL